MNRTLYPLVAFSIMGIFGFFIMAISGDIRVGGLLLAFNAMIGGMISLLEVTIEKNANHDKDERRIFRDLTKKEMKEIYNNGDAITAI